MLFSVCWEIWREVKWLGSQNFDQSLAFRFSNQSLLMPAESDSGWRVQSLNPGRTRAAQKHLLIILLNDGFYLEEAEPPGESWEYPELGCHVSPVPRKNSTISVLRKSKSSDLLAGRLCVFKKDECVFTWTNQLISQKLLWVTHPPPHLLPWSVA